MVWLHLGHLTIVEVLAGGSCGDASCAVRGGANAGAGCGGGMTGCWTTGSAAGVVNGCWTAHGAGCAAELPGKGCCVGRPVPDTVGGM